MKAGTEQILDVLRLGAGNEDGPGGPKAWFSPFPDSHSV